MRVEKLLGDFSFTENIDEIHKHKHISKDETKDTMRKRLVDHWIKIQRDSFIYYVDYAHLDFS